MRKAEREKWEVKEARLLYLSELRPPVIHDTKASHGMAAPL
jgi:hypothetical protein